MRRERRDLAIGLCVGGLSRELARHALLVGRIDQRQRVRSLCQDSVEGRQDTDWLLDLAH